MVFDDDLGVGSGDCGGAAEADTAFFFDPFGGIFGKVVVRFL